MSDRTTLNVKKDAHRAAQEAKKDSETWSDYLRRCTDHEPYAAVAMDMDTSTLRDIVSEQIQEHMDKMTVNVDIDGLDLEGSELSESDVRTIVQTEIEKHVHERARQL